MPTNEKSSPATVNRRHLLIGAAAMTAIPLHAIAMEDLTADVSIKALNDLGRSGVSENHELISAYSDLLAARAELAAAEDALEWLADEWKHRWPLAPEEILWGANSSPREGGECDIIGRPITRNHVELTKCMSAKFRKIGGKSCFGVLTIERLEEEIAEWTNRVPKGRTPKALEANVGLRQRMIGEYQRKLALARDYHAETERLRNLAGVEQIKQRVTDAKNRMYHAAEAISFLPAYTLHGLQLKAEAISVSFSEYTIFLADRRPLGEIARLVQSVLVMKEGTLA
jgi:hypothetical protein